MKPLNTQHKELKIPPILSLFVNVFAAESKREARLLFYAAVDALYPNRSVKFKRNNIKLSFELMRSMSPKNDIERALCAQFIVGHLIGMQKLAQGYFKDKQVGLKLLKLSNESLGNYCGIAR